MVVMAVVMSTFCVVGLCTHRYKVLYKFWMERGGQHTNQRGVSAVSAIYSSVFSAKVQHSVQPGTATLPKCMKCDSTWENMR